LQKAIDMHFQTCIINNPNLYLQRQNPLLKMPFFMDIHYLVLFMT
jgi:hypothetical protein